MVPQSTCSLASQGSTLEANQSESRAEGFDRIPSHSINILITEERALEGDPTDVARVCGEALPEATQEAAPKGQETTTEVF